MKGAIAWMSDNHVASNLLMLLIIFGGYFSITTVKQEIFPEIPLGNVTVEVIYRGASPEEIEQSVILIIEDVVSGLDGVRKVSSIAMENVGSVNIEVEHGVDASDVKVLVQTEIDRITTFPKDAEKPIVKESVRKSPVIQVGVCGDVDEFTLTKYTQRVRDELLRLPNISQVGISGLKNYEISIEVSENALREYGLTFAQITTAIKMGSLDLPGGKIKTKNGEILIRTKGLGFTKKDYEDIIIKSDFYGNTLRIKDVAEVLDAFEESDLLTSFDGKPSIQLTVYRVGEQGAIEVAADVKKYIKKTKHSLPEGIYLVPWNDRSLLLEQRMDLLFRNAILGLLLVFISLAIFLDLRLALWVTVGIGISFFGSFIVMKLLGVSINMISLFGFILVLGIVVDDAIVVGENIFANREKGLSASLASKDGALRVSTPVIFAVLTTMAAFGPLLFVDGTMGVMMKVIPIIVMAVLGFSLIESLLILPAHLSGVNLKSTNPFFQFFTNFSLKADALLGRFIERRYVPFLRDSLKNKLIVVVVSFSLLLITVGVIKGGIVDFVFFPEIESDNVVVILDMPKGTSANDTRDVLKELELSAKKVEMEIHKRYPKEKTIFKHSYSIVGEQPSLKRGPHGNKGGNIDPTKAEINISLPISDDRNFTTTEIMNLWRDYSSHITGAKSLIFKASLMSAGNAIEIQLSANNNTELLSAIAELKQKITEYSGISDLRDDFEKGKFELKLKLKPEAATLGLTLADLSMQVRSGFYGDEALRLQRGRDEVKVMVRYKSNERESLTNVENMMIRTRSGGEVPFTEVAQVTYGRGYSQITRSHQMRIVTVLASLDETKANANLVNKELKQFIEKDLKKKYPGLIYSREGAQKEQKRTMGSLLKGFIIALFLIYLLLAIPFKSYIQPFIIMSAIPFGFIGAVFGHYVMGYDLSMFSGMGLIALAGVVVNDSLVLVDFVNGLHKNEKMPIVEAIITGAKSRFRPIMLTSITTFLGLAPMIMETSLQAKFIIPMAISLGFGIIFATVITLILVPTGILILDSITRKISSL